MSTWEENGQSRLTRRQLREIRLTGSTPVITEEAAAVAASQPTTVLPRAAEPVEIAPAPQVEPPKPDAPLTRRQMRALEHAREAASASGAQPAAPGVQDVQPTQDVQPAQDAQPAADVRPEQEPGLVSGVPSFAPAPPSGAREDAAQGVLADREMDQESSSSSEQDRVAAIFGGADTAGEAVAGSAARQVPTNAEAQPIPRAAAATGAAERPMVGAAFGIGVKAERRDPTAGALFDELLDGDSSSSQHGASTALIFTPSPGMGSLSGPIASTGEMLITGTYQLPDGLGSQGHAHGTADGKDADAVLLDGELAPASSPTPIAASAAVSTSRSAGEVIRPPAPDKGNKLMLTLAVVAGSLAVVLAATLVIAFTTGVFG